MQTTHNTITCSAEVFYTVMEEVRMDERWCGSALSLTLALQTSSAAVNVC